jgi:hypothetical protein
MGGFIFSCQYFLLLSKMPHCGLNFGIGFKKKTFLFDQSYFFLFLGGRGGVCRSTLTKNGSFVCEHQNHLSIFAFIIIISLLLFLVLLPGWRHARSGEPAGQASGAHDVGGVHVAALHAQDGPPASQHGPGRSFGRGCVPLCLNHSIYFGFHLLHEK